ncbi:MAG: ABC transporter permease, partial [Paracoccaceae bacterium]
TIDATVRVVSLLPDEWSLFETFGNRFLGFGLPSSAPSLGELTLQAKQNLQAPWLGFSAFFTFAIMLALLVFIFEGVRDAFDPRKIFR